MERIGRCLKKLPQFKAIHLIVMMMVFLFGLIPLTFTSYVKVSKDGKLFIHLFTLRFRPKLSLKVWRLD